MKSRFLSCWLAISILAAGCSLVQKSIYKRVALPKDMDPQMEQQIFWGVVQAMRSQPFVDELKKKFPSVTQAHLLKTDIRWDVLQTNGTRTFFISFGLKDATVVPEADRLVNFLVEYGSNQMQQLVANAKKQKAP